MSFGNFLSCRDRVITSQFLPVLLKEFKVSCSRTLQGSSFALASGTLPSSRPPVL